MFLLATTTLGVLAACGGSDGDVADAPPDAGASEASPDSATSAEGGDPLVSPKATAADYCESTLGRFVAGFGKCCTPDDQQTDQYKLQVGLFALAEKSCAPRLEASLASGRVGYDATAAQACYPAYQQAVDSIPCGGNVPTFLPEALASCAKVFTGRVAEAGACRGDYECLDGLTCVGFTTGSDGTCKRPPALNEACGEAQGDAGGQLDVHVRFGFGKHPKCSTGTYCFNRTCRAEAQPGGACSSDDQCPDDLKCRQAVCSNAPVEDLGGPCKSHSDCKAPLFCEQPSFGAAGTCQPKKAAGEPCGTFALCKGRCDRVDGGTSGTCKAYCGSE